MTISKELLDELLSGVERPEDLLGDKGLMKELKVRLMERMLGEERPVFLVLPLFDTLHTTLRQSAHQSVRLFDTLHTFLR